VLSQAAFYLSWLCSARHEFEALVKEKLGSEVAEAIDWRNPRMVCIAASFSHHARVEAVGPGDPGAAPACLRDLYGELDEALTPWGEVEVAPLLHYIAYRRMVNVASVVFRPKHEAILVYLKVDPNTVELEAGFSRDMRGIGHLGTGDLEVRIASAADLEKAGPLIRRAFEAA
jgi:predicted transport protein